MYERSLKIADRASNDISGKKIAVQDANYSTSQSRRIYALGQCTLDLSSLECGTCLRSAISMLPTYGRDSRLFFRSCNVRYEICQFYSSLSPPPAPALPASSKGTDQDVKQTKDAKSR